MKVRERRFARTFAQGHSPEWACVTTSLPYKSTHCSSPVSGVIESFCLMQKNPLLSLLTTL
jgi:hypothetical protein